MRHRSLALVAFGLLLATAFSAGATTLGKTADGRDYAIGGVTVAELRSLAADKDRYDLWVTTAAKDSGAFLSDVRLKIIDADNAIVLDTTMIGPWMFVDLAPGTYTIEASMGDQKQKHTTRVVHGMQRQAIIYFDSPAKVSPDWKTPFERSPYAAN